MCRSVFGSKKKVVEEEIIEESHGSAPVANTITSMKRTADDSKPLLQSTCTSTKIFERSNDEPQNKMSRISSYEVKEVGIFVILSFYILSITSIYFS